MEHVCSPLRFNYEIRSIKLVYSDYKWISKLTKIIRFLKCKHKVKIIAMRTNQSLVQNQTSGQGFLSAPPLPLGHVARLPSTGLSLASHWNLHEMLLFFFFFVLRQFYLLNLNPFNFNSGNR